ncbi:unnamed protein product [Lasius platythorax]|uniref:Uncharacterized protein n=1 Tax=Lasius platythorax TaxID=488582 RepID=A0AAV2P0I4_9HYME
MPPYPTEVRGALFPTPVEGRGTTGGTCVRSMSIDLFQLTYAPARLGLYLLPLFYPLREDGCVHTTHRHKDEMEGEAEGERERAKLRRETQRPEFDSRLLTS